MKLDENERSSITRLMKIKGMMIAKAIEQEKALDMGISGGNKLKKKKIAILILVFISTLSFVFAIFYVIAADRNHEKTTRIYFEVSFDARISSEDQIGYLSSSDRNIGKEVYIPVQTKVHIVAICGETILVETPFIIEIDGERHEVSAHSIPMDNIDKSSYAKGLLRPKIQEREQRINSKIRNDLITSVIAAVVLFSLFSLVFLLIEKKCDTRRKFKILFGYLLFNAILSISFMILCIQYMKGMK